MSQFVNNTWFKVHTCGSCGLQYAMTAEFKRRRLEDHKIFYCPAGCQRRFTGPTEAQQLKEELERTTQMLQAAAARANTVAKAHKKMRARIMNGVCPCCNRTFQNLMGHMRTEHPEFKEARTIQVLRQAFSMSQSDVAREVGVSPVYVSAYERNAYLPTRAKEQIDAWMAKHTNA